MATTALPVDAGGSWRTVAAGSATAVVTTFLAVTLGLAAIFNALAVVATFAVGATAAGAAAAVVSTGFAFALGNAAATTFSAISAGDFFHTYFVPLHVAAESVQRANAGLDGRVVAPWCFMGFTAVAPDWRALSAILRAAVAGFSALALPVGTVGSATVTRAAPERGDFVGADAVPFDVTAIGILVTDTSLDGRIVTSWLRVWLTTVGALARPAVLFAGETVFVDPALAISAAPTRTISTAFRLDLIHTDGIPGKLTAERIHRTNAGLHGRVVTSRSFLWLTAGARPGPWTATAVAAAKFLYFADANLVPCCGAAIVVLVTNAVLNGCVRAARSVLRFAAVATWPWTATAVATTKFLYFAHAYVVPSGGAAVVVLVTDAVLNGRVVTSWPVMGLAAIATWSRSSTAIRSVPIAGAFTVTDAVSSPAAGVVGLAASAGTGIAGAVVPASTAAVATA